MATLVREASPLATLPPRVPRPAALSASSDSPAIRDGRWAAARLDQGDLGPSLMELVLWFPELDDAALAAALGPAAAPAALRMNQLAVRALLPERAAQGTTIGDDVELDGPQYASAAFEGHGFFGARAMAVAGGLLVAVRTGG